MKLDSNFNDVAPQQGGFMPPNPGGHILKVVGVSDKPSNAGNDMVTLSLDIAQGEFKGAFERFPKKFFQLVNGDNLPYFKGMIEAFQKSNPPAAMKRAINGLDFDADGLVDLLVGGNLREVEYVNGSGDVAVGMEIAYLVPVSEVPNLKPLPLKKLPKETNRNAGMRNTFGSTGANSTGASGRQSIPEDDLPF